MTWINPHEIRSRWCNPMFFHKDGITLQNHKISLWWLGRLNTFGFFCGGLAYGEPNILVMSCVWCEASEAPVEVCIIRRVFSCITGSYGGNRTDRRGSAGVTTISEEEESTTERERKLKNVTYNLTHNCKRKFRCCCVCKYVQGEPFQTKIT